MAPKKMKPGLVLSYPVGDTRGALITELVEKVEYYDPDTIKSLRRQYGPLFVHMAETRFAHDDDWYDASDKRWQRDADVVADQSILALGKMSPKGHYFGARRDRDMIEWGYWPEPERNPEEELHDAVFYEGYKENPTLRRLGGSPTSDVYEYRGRRIIVSRDKKGVLVQVVRKATRRGYDVDAVVAEYYSAHAFPEQEARDIIEEWHEESKAKRRAKRKRIGIKLPAEVDPEVRARRLGKEADTLERLRSATEEALGLHAPEQPRKVKLKAEGEAKYIGPKAGGALFKYGNATIEMRAAGEEIETEAILMYPAMVHVTVIGPDNAVVTAFGTWGGTRALGRAKNEIARKAAKANPEPQNGKLETRGRSFMRRMMRI